MHKHVETLIIGAGQAGLATSYYLTEYDHEHIILEKDRIGEAWRSKLWDSFTLVTPNWTLQLPGFAYAGDNPDGFLKREDVVQYLEGYAESFAPPVETGVEVTSVHAAASQNGFEVETNHGTYTADQVVVATGTFQQPNMPDFAGRISGDVNQLHSSEYRKPESLPPGAVLVVGSGQSGCQITDELNEAGRKVYLCTGSADRLPRWYRGQDSFWWAEKLGIFDQTVSDLPGPKARFAPNPQVSGKDGGKTLSLHGLAAAGVTLLGRLESASGSWLSIGDNLMDHLAQADEFANEFKKGVDKYIEKNDMDLPEYRLPVSRVGYDVDVVAALDLHEANITSIIWATGYTYDYTWIAFPVFDDTGYPIQTQGVTAQPGLYFVGLHWLNKRKSGLMLGVGEDAEHVATHIHNHAHERA